MCVPILCMPHYVSGKRQEGMSESQDCCEIRKIYLQVENSHVTLCLRGV